MLPTDIALINDPITKPIVEEFARDNDAFFRDFAASFGKLLALGKIDCFVVSKRTTTTTKHSFDIFKYENRMPSKLSTRVQSSRSRGA
jgi:catalase (peroxidase I)